VVHHPHGEDIALVAVLTSGEYLGSYVAGSAAGLRVSRHVASPGYAEVNYHGDGGLRVVFPQHYVLEFDVSVHDA